MFSRVSIDFGTSRPLSSPLVDDEAGDIGLQHFPTDWVSSIGHLPLDMDSPYLGVSHTLVSAAIRAVQVAPISPTPISFELTHQSFDGLVSPVTSTSPKPLGISPSWATNGLCISGLPSCGSTPAHSLVNNTPPPVGQPDPPPPGSSQVDYAAPSPPLFPISLDQISDEEALPEDFTGVLNVGYPLRPSEERYGLVGLGFPSGMENQDRRERQEAGLLLPDFMGDSDYSSLSSPSMDYNSTPDFMCSLNDAPVATPRELFVIAEADDEDWASPESIAGSPMLVDEPTLVFPVAGKLSPAEVLLDDTFECLLHSQLHPLPSPYSPSFPASPPSEPESTNNTVHSVIEAIPPSSLASITAYSPESVIVHNDVPHDLGFIERLRYRKRGPADDLFQVMF